MNIGTVPLIKFVKKFTMKMIDDMNAEKQYQSLKNGTEAGLELNP